MHAVTKRVLLFFVFALAPAISFSVGAPALSEKLASNSNDLQRAAWACENGAPTFMQVSGAAVRPRVFLGSVDASAKVDDIPALILQGPRLSGFGRMSNGRGWFNIQFDCTLSQDLRQATAFTLQTLSPIPPSQGQPPHPGVATSARVDRMAWYIDTPGPVGLTHGVPETDDRDFRASCLKGTGEIHVPLTNTVETLKPKGFVTVNIASGDGSGLYIAQGVMDDNYGVAMPAFTIPSSDPLWKWMARDKSLLINIGSAYVYEVSLKGSGKAVKTLVSACSR